MRYFPTRAVYLLAALAIVAGVGAVPALAQNPIAVAREAYRKAQEEAKRQREEAQRQKEQGSKPAAPQTAASPAAPQPAVTPAQAAPAQAPSSQPVLLGDLTKSDAPVAVAPVDPKNMPDIIGIHLHMSSADAQAVLRKEYPRTVGAVVTTLPLPTVDKPVFSGIDITNGANTFEQVAFDVTPPPNPQVVWHVGRRVGSIHANRATVLAALREKYGKETLALPDNGSQGIRPAPNDSAIAEMYWLRDAQGRAAALPRNPKDLMSLSRDIKAAHPYELLPELQGNPTPPPTWATSFAIGVFARISPGNDPQIIEGMDVSIMDLPHALRAATITTEWWKAAVEKLRQQDIEKSKQAKPRL